MSAARCKAKRDVHDNIDSSELRRDLQYTARHVCARARLQAAARPRPHVPQTWAIRAVVCSGLVRSTAKGCTCARVRRMRQEGAGAACVVQRSVCVRTLERPPRVAASWGLNEGAEEVEERGGGGGGGV